MKKETEIIKITVILGYIGCIFLLFFLLPQKTFSENEKRNLSPLPELNKQTMLSGEYSEDIEKYLADHIPGRSFFIELNAWMDFILNQQTEKEIYIGKNNRLFERPVRVDDTVITKNMEAINSFADEIGRDIDIMIVPSSGWVLSDDICTRSDPYIDDEIISSIYSLANENVHPIMLIDKFREMNRDARELLYYKTDHHWTSFGAWYACKMFSQQKEKNILPQNAYSIKLFPGFYGSTYSRSCFWNWPSESIDLWDSGGEFQVTISDKDKVHDGLFYEERLTNADKYPVFLDGNHPLVSIENLNSRAKGSLLIIRDSFGNSFSCFAADLYKNVTLLDLRYYKTDVANFVKDNSFDDILVLYSIRNFMSDANIVWLR